MKISEMTFKEITKLLDDVVTALDELDGCVEIQDEITLSTIKLKMFIEEKQKLARGE